MSLVPGDQGKAIVQRTEVQSSDPKDPKSKWDKFIDFLRGLIGRKPRELAERFVQAKVVQQEADAQDRLLKAEADYQRAMAEVRKMDRESKGKQAKDQAQARLTRTVAKLLEAKSRDPAEALEDLRAIMERIALEGGNVELQLPEPSEDDEDAPEEDETS